MSDKSKQPGDKSLAGLLVRAARIYRNRLSYRLASLGLVAGQEQVLQILFAADSLTMSQLAERLHVRPPTASKTVSRLTGLGLIKRLQLEKEDSRIIRIALTSRGEALAQLVDSLWLETEAELIADFDTKDQKRLRKLLRRAIHNLSTIDTTSADQSTPVTMPESTLDNH